MVIALLYLSSPLKPSRDTPIPLRDKDQALQPAIQGLWWHFSAFPRSFPHPTPQANSYILCILNNTCSPYSHFCLSCFPPDTSPSSPLSPSTPVWLGPLLPVKIHTWRPHRPSAINNADPATPLSYLFNIVASFVLHGY